MVELNDQPAKSEPSQNPPDEGDEPKANPDVNPDPRPEEAVSEENRLKMEQAEKDEQK